MPYCQNAIAAFRRKPFIWKSFDKEFCIEPEYLDNEEIKHELRVRNAAPTGERRTISARLRACLSEERAAPGAYAMYPVGHPNEELKQCVRGLDKLKALLNQVSLDPITHDRFMTVFLHYEARLNRIAKKKQDDNMTIMIFQKNEEFSELYNEFEQKVSQMMHPLRATNKKHVENTPIQSNNEPKRISQIPATSISQRNQGGSIDMSLIPYGGQQLAPDSNLALVPNVSRASVSAQSTSNNNDRVSIVTVHDRSSHAPSHDTDQVLLGAQQIPSDQMGGANTFNIVLDSITDPTIRESIAKSIGTEQNLGDGLALLRHLLGQGTQVPTHANATMNTNDSARLSEQFHPSQMPQITPIPSTANVVAQPYSHPNAHASSVSNSMQPNNNGGLLQIEIPPNNFGENYANSLPSNFGNNVIYQPNANFPNTQFAAPQGSNPVNGRFDHQVADGSGIRLTQANQSIQSVQAPISVNTQGSAAVGYTDQFQNNLRGVALQGSQVAPNDFLPPSGGHHAHNINYNQHAQANNDHPRQPANATDEKLDLIMASLASLANEVQSFHLWKHSIATDSSRVNVPMAQNLNPNATYTVNAGRYHGNESYSSVTRGSPNFVPIHKWNWKFSADKSSDVPERRDLAAFLKKLELYRQSEQLTYEQIHQKFHYLIEGCVYEWYMQYRHNFANWEQLLEGLKKQFTTPLTHFMKVAKLAARRQQKSETAMAYIASIQREFDELGMYSEKEKISIIQNGLNDRLRNVALAHAWNSVQEMDLHLRTIEVADELRNETEVQAQKRPFFFRKSINAIETECIGDVEMGEEENENKAELETEGNVNCQAMMVRPQFNSNYKKGYNTNEMKEQPRKPTCYNCKSELHRLVDCGEPISRIFCFRCGREGVRAPNCTCGPKNAKYVACSTAEACDIE